MLLLMFFLLKFECLLRAKCIFVFYLCVRIMLPYNALNENSIKIPTAKSLDKIYNLRQHKQLTSKQNYSKNEKRTRSGQKNLEKRHAYVNVCVCMYVFTY